LVVPRLDGLSGVDEVVAAAQVAQDPSPRFGDEPSADGFGCIWAAAAEGVGLGDEPAQLSRRGGAEGELKHCQPEVESSAKVPNQFAGSTAQVVLQNVA
jgi:hypothetical protein